MKPTKTCDKCNRQITTNNFNKHYNSCDGILKEKQIKDEWKQENGLYKCPQCKKEYKKTGIATHIWRMHGTGINHNPNKTYKEGRYAWNKGLTKENDERVKKFGNTYSHNISLGITTPSFKGKHHTKITKEQIGDKLSRNNKGGRSRWYEVTNPSGIKFKVQGTWELAFVQVLNILDDNWIKPGVGNKEHTYEWINKKGEKHFYTPDFYSPKLKKYFEVKGYWWGEDKLKMEYVLTQHFLNLEIIQKKELKSYLTLVSSIFILEI